MPLHSLRQTLKQTGLPNCTVADGGGIQSLERTERHTFLQTYPYPDAPPAFSVVAVANRDHVSKVLQLSWDVLHAYSADQDRQVISEDGIVPGGSFLGIAVADHWAVALPFSDTSAAITEKYAHSVDQNRYPRTALLEAILRFVSKRLGAASPDVADALNLSERSVSQAMNESFRILVLCDRQTWCRRDGAVRHHVVKRPARTDSRYRRRARPASRT